MVVILLFLFGVLLCWFTLWAGEKVAKKWKNVLEKGEINL